MAGKLRSGNAVPVSDLAAAILDPALKRRAGISLGLIQSWDEIAGPRLGALSRPEKMDWPRRLHEDDPFQPATLVVACEGFAALQLQHETGELIGRINAFLGFAAVGRIRIVQKPVRAAERQRPRAPRPLTEAERLRIAGTTDVIEDEGLREALRRLGASVVGTRR